MANNPNSFLTLPIIHNIHGYGEHIGLTSNVTTVTFAQTRLNRQACASHGNIFRTGIAAFVIEFPFVQDEQFPDCLKFEILNRKQSLIETFNRVFYFRRNRNAQTRDAKINAMMDYIRLTRPEWGIPNLTLNHLQI